MTRQAAIPTRCRWRPLIDRAVTLHLPTLLYNAVPLIAMRPPALRLCTHHPCLPSPISGSGRDISQHTPAPTNPPPTAVSSTTPLAGLQKMCATSNARAPGRLKPQLGLDSSSSSLPWSDHRPGPCHAVRQPAGHAPAARPWAETGKALLRSHALTAHPCKPSRQGPWHLGILLEDEQDPQHLDNYLGRSSATWWESNPGPTLIGLESCTEQPLMAPSCEVPELGLQPSIE